MQTNQPATTLSPNVTTEIRFFMTSRLREKPGFHHQIQNSDAE
ncbi:hypothetical protein [Calothrix sp. PCC 6303]|nr:hypothetical protein [Calothrix sp. PCC 6303]